MPSQPHFSPEVVKKLEEWFLDYSLIDVWIKEAIYEILSVLGIIAEWKAIRDVLDNIQSHEDYMWLFGKSGIFVWEREVELAVIDYFKKDNDKLLQLVKQVPFHGNVGSIQIFDLWELPEDLDKSIAYYNQIWMHALAWYRHIGNVDKRQFFGYLNWHRLLSELAITDTTVNRLQEPASPGTIGVRQRDYKGEVHNMPWSTPFIHDNVMDQWIQYDINWNPRNPMEIYDEDGRSIGVKWNVWPWPDPIGEPGEPWVDGINNQTEWPTGNVGPDDSWLFGK